jgi:hypothetical protein
MQQYCTFQASIGESISLTMMFRQTSVMCRHQFQPYTVSSCISGGYMEFLEAATSLLRLKTNKEKLVQRLEDYTVPRSINTHTHTHRIQNSRLGGVSHIYCLFICTEERSCSAKVNTVISLAPRFLRSCSNFLLPFSIAIFNGVRPSFVMALIFTPLYRRRSNHSSLASVPSIIPTQSSQK